jgi:hypothetical protein
MRKFTTEVGPTDGQFHAVMDGVDFSESGELEINILRFNQLPDECQMSAK